LKSMAHFPFFWRVWQKFEIYGTFAKKGYKADVWKKACFSRHQQTNQTCHVDVALQSACQTHVLPAFFGAAFFCRVPRCRLQYIMPNFAEYDKMSEVTLSRRHVTHMSQN
jgi:hypothetical protein